ncbi:MAG TPA: hypothetical protein VL125_03485 [Pelobium sp.]|nr:hypothetical protein [Pelobium sp.]
MMNKIEFQDMEFPVREIELPEIGTVLISTTTLNELLMTKVGGYVSDEAISVDERIYCFIDEDAMGLPDDALVAPLMEFSA